MSEAPPTTINITAWVEEAKARPVEYHRRQATEIIIHSLAYLPEKYKGSLCLKGGLLMVLAFSSKRATQDIDITAHCEDHVAFAESIRADLDKALMRAAAALGYLKLEIKVQTIKLQPRAADFPGASFPALDVKIAFAEKGTRDHDRLSTGTGINTVGLDISFNEPIDDKVELILDRDHKTVSAYSIEALVAEKFRAMLQQEERNRYRSQDVYDINFLLEKTSFTAEQRKTILGLLIKSAAARAIAATKDSIRKEEVKKEPGKSGKNVLKMSLRALYLSSKRLLRQ